MSKFEAGRWWSCVAIATMAMGACNTTPPASPIRATFPVTKIPVGNAPGGMAPTFNYIYVANEGASSVTVIDPRTDTVVRAIELEGGTPGKIKAFRAGRYVMVADVKRNALVVIDSLKDHQILQTVTLEDTPVDFAVGLDDRTVVVAQKKLPDLHVLTFEADRAKPPARRDLTIRDTTLADATVDSDGTWATVTTPDALLVELATGTIKPLGNGAAKVVMLASEIVADNPKSVAALVIHKESSGVSIYPLEGEGGETTLTGLGVYPSALAIDPEKTRAYIAMNGSNALAVVDYKTRTHVSDLPVVGAPTAIALADPLPSAAYRVQHGLGGFREVWVSFGEEDTLRVYEGETLDPIGTVKSGGGPHQILFRGDKAYISNQKDNSVSVVSRKSLVH